MKFWADANFHNFGWTEFLKWLSERCDGYYTENKVCITNAWSGNPRIASLDMDNQKA